MKLKTESLNVGLTDWGFVLEMDMEMLHFF